MTISTGCDQCQALMIQGVYCHEHGCPNAKAPTTHAEAFAMLSSGLVDVREEPIDGCPVCDEGSDASYYRVDELCMDCQRMDSRECTFDAEGMGVLAHECGCSECCEAIAEAGECPANGGAPHWWKGDTCMQCGEDKTEADAAIAGGES